MARRIPGDVWGKPSAASKLKSIFLTSGMLNSMTSIISEPTPPPLDSFMESLERKEISSRGIIKIGKIKLTRLDNKRPDSVHRMFQQLFYTREAVAEHPTVDGIPSLR